MFTFFCTNFGEENGRKFHKSDVRTLETARMSNSSTANPHLGNYRA